MQKRCCSPSSRLPSRAGWPLSSELGGSGPFHAHTNPARKVSYPAQLSMIFRKSRTNLISILGSPVWGLLMLCPRIVVVRLLNARLGGISAPPLFTTDCGALAPAAAAQAEGNV